MIEELPPPIEDGRRAQTPVEYLGPLIANFTRRGVSSGRTYHFAQSPGDRWSWVLSEDVNRFRLHPDYLVHDEVAIDPVHNAQRAWEERIQAIEHTFAEPRPPIGVHRPKVGRPRTPEAAVIEAWHLHNHCGWRWRDVAQHQGIDRERPEAAVERRVARWLKSNPERAGDEFCSLCDSNGCPPPPE